MSQQARLILNPQAEPASAAYGLNRQGVMNQTGFDAAYAEISSWPGYAPTPLLVLPGLASELGLGQVFYKDERGRFGLGSFKALGGAYAVANVLRHFFRVQHGHLTFDQATVLQALDAAQAGRG